MRLDPDIVPDLVSSLCLKGYICTINSVYHLAEISELFPVRLLRRWHRVPQ